MTGSVTEIDETVSSILDLLDNTEGTKENRAVAAEFSEVLAQAEEVHNPQALIFHGE